MNVSKIIFSLAVLLILVSPSALAADATNTNASPSNIALKSISPEVFVTSGCSNGFYCAALNVVNGTKIVARFSQTFGRCCPDFGYKLAYANDVHEIFVPISWYGSDGLVGSVWVVDASSNTFIENLTGFRQPIASQYDPVNQVVYVLDSYTDNISIISTETLKVTGTISLHGGPDSLASYMTFDPINKELYVSNRNASDVLVINASTNKVIEKISTGTYPYQMAFDPANDYMYIASSVGLLVLAGNGNKLVHVIKNDGGYVLAYDSGNRDMYSTGGSNILLFNSTNKLVGIVGVECSKGPCYPGSEGYDQTDRSMWISCEKFVLIVRGTTIEKLINFPNGVGALAVS